MPAESIAPSAARPARLRAPGICATVAALALCSAAHAAPHRRTALHHPHHHASAIADQAADQPQDQPQPGDSLAADTLSGTDQGAMHTVQGLADATATDPAPAIQLASYRPPAPLAAAVDPSGTPSDIIDPDAAATGDVLQTGTSSWYGTAWRGRRTASGTRFNPAEMTAASHYLPLGTRVLVTIEGTARSVLVTITDRQGAASRVIDLSMAAARKIGMIGMGTARVILRRA